VDSAALMKQAFNVMGDGQKASGLVVIRTCKNFFTELAM
jgi:hypothetical protein